tara:strand:+ start:938 stop:1270 length:333 start_codon:yes stop_codon:yes gene_type:complete
MLLLKIIIIILSIIFFVFIIAVCFSAGLMRGLKIMSVRDLKRSAFETVVVQKVFKDDPNVDPFFYSLYLKDKRKEEADAFKKEVVRLQKEIAVNKTLSKPQKKKKSNGKK